MGCSSEEKNKNTQSEPGLVLDLQYPEALLALNDFGRKRFEDEVMFYQFSFHGAFFQKITEPIDRKKYSSTVFSDIPFDENLIIHVKALDKEKQTICYGEQVVRHVSGSPVAIKIALLCPAQRAVQVETDSSEIDLASLGSSDSEQMLSDLPQRKSFPWVYSTLLLRPASSVPSVIQVEFDGYLENEVQNSQQHWQDEVLERTTVGDVERWSKAPVILEIKERKENGELVEAQTQHFPNGKVGYLLKKGLVFLFKTEAAFREFPFSRKTDNSNLRVDHIHLQGTLKILSAPQAIKDPSFYLNAKNWMDITPSDPFPLVKIVSK